MTVDGMTGGSASGSRRAGGRSCLLFVLIGGVALAVVGLLGLVVLDRLLGDLPDLATDSDIVTDEAQLAMTEGQLDQVEQLLEALPSYEGGSSIHRDGCRTDSGDLFQPYVQRTWSVDRASTERRADELATALSEGGWTVAEADRWGGQHVTFESSEGWAAGGSLYRRLDGGIGVEVRIQLARPCRLPSGR